MCREERTPGIYLYSRSSLVTTWYVNIEFDSEEYELTDGILDTVISTMYEYLSSRYGSFRVIGVFRAESGVYVLTRFISSPMIFGAIIDYIMELQCVVRTCHSKFSVEQSIDLSRTKLYMLSYYDYFLRYQKSVMKHRK